MRQFDLAQANHLIPHLHTAFTAMREWLERAQVITGELHQAGVTDDPGAPIADPQSATGRLRTERDALVLRLRDRLNELEDLGVEVKALDGLVDFRATLAGRPVYLCWRYGERAICFWHELDAGFAGRQPIDEPAAFAPSYLS